MTFYIQHEHDIQPVVTFQLDTEGIFGVVAETPNLTTSNCDCVIVHIQGNPRIQDNHVNAKNNGLYLVSEEGPQNYSINYVGKYIKYL